MYDAVYLVYTIYSLLKLMNLSLILNAYFKAMYIPRQQITLFSCSLSKHCKKCVQPSSRRGQLDLSIHQLSSQFGQLFLHGLYASITVIYLIIKEVHEALFKFSNPRSAGGEKLTMLMSTNHDAPGPQPTNQGLLFLYQCRVAFPMGTSDFPSSNQRENEDG